MSTSGRGKRERRRKRRQEAAGGAARARSIRRLGFGVSVVLLLLVAAAAFWWFAVRSDAELATSAPAIPDDPVTGAAQQPAESGLPDGVDAFRIAAEQSQASYFAREKLARLSVPSTAQGTTPSVVGTIYLDAQGLNVGRVSKITVDLRQLRSDESRRDRNVQRVLDTTRFPEATFVVAAIDGYPEVFPAGGAEVEMTMRGVLEIRGVSREVAWQVLARRDGAVLTALGTLSIVLADFGVPVPNVAGFVTVESEMTLQVQVVASTG